MQAYSMPCCGSVGGFRARAVSRKTPIYFILINILHDFFNIPDNNADDNAGARIAGLYGCPICGLGLTPPELEEHFAQEVSLYFFFKIHPVFIATATTTSQPPQCSGGFLGEAKSRSESCRPAEESGPSTSNSLGCKSIHEVNNMER